MLAQLASHATEIKFILAALVGGGALLADVAVDPKGLEDWGLKGLLLIALGYAVNLLLSQQKEHKAEMKETWDLHKKDAETREAKLIKCIEESTKATVENAALTKEQTDYFKAVTRNVVDEKLKGGKANIP